jgi:integrase
VSSRLGWPGELPSSAARPALRRADIEGFARDLEAMGRAPAAVTRRVLDRSELGALLVAAGLGPPAGHALILALALNGLRVSEAAGVGIEHRGLECGHRTLAITRKGGKVVTISLAPRTARATGLAVCERTEGPVSLARDGRRLDRYGAGRVVGTTARNAGITS